MPAPQSPPPEHYPPLSLSASLLYGLGEVPITVMMVLFGIFTLFFYSTVMRLPPTLVGIGVGAGLVVDALLDPYIGYRSDRLRHRFGRRHAFMLPGALLSGPGFFLLFSPPRTLGGAGLFAWLCICSLLLRTASAVYRIPYLSLGAELTRDYDGRTRIMAVRAIFGLLGMLAAAGLSFVLFFPSAGAGDPKLRYDGYPRMGLAFGAVMTLAGVASAIGTWRHRTAAPENSGAPRIAFFAGFRTALADTAFRSTWFSFTLFFLGVVLNGALALHYFTWYAEIRASRALSAIQASFYIGALAGVVLWLALARRTEKKTLYVAAIAGTSMLLCGAVVLIGPGRLFGTGHPLPLAAGHLLAGIFASAVWVIPASMTADVADADELKTGLRREGMFFGILNFGEKIAGGAALLSAGLLLTVSGRLFHGAPAAAPAPPWTIAVLYGVVPALALAAAAVCMIFYHLDRNAVGAIQRRLDARSGAAGSRGIEVAQRTGT